jgi:diaminopimelate epimerase
MNFIKMQGLGNDFVILQEYPKDAPLSLNMIQYICDRRLGIGCDQLLILQASAQKADTKMLVFNSDGSPAEACGNGVRCVARLLADTLRRPQVTVEMAGKVLRAEVQKEGMVSIEMGRPSFSKQDISNTFPQDDTLHLNIGIAGLTPGACVSVGNPHIVFFVDDISTVNVKEIGSKIEHHSYFSNRINVEFVQVIDNHTLKVRVWERGAGETQACGSGACASQVIAHKLGKVGASSTVYLPGGALIVRHSEEEGIIMTGPADYVFQGTLY